MGLNESGKMTILEAIDYFSKGMEVLDPQELAGRIRPEIHGLIPISERANFNGVTRITAGLELDDQEVDQITEYLRASHGYNVTRIERNFTVSDRYQFENSQHTDSSVTWWINIFGRLRGGRVERNLSRQSTEILKQVFPFVGDRIPPIWYFPNFLFTFPQKFYLTPQSGDTNIDRFYRALLQDILNVSVPGATIEQHILERAESGTGPQRNALDQLLLEIGRKITQDVFEAWDQMFHHVVDKRIVLRIDSDEKGQWFVEFRIEDADGAFFIHERSLGFCWFFVFLLLTTYRGAREDSRPNLVFLLDEPASNLHSSAQAKLLGCLERLAGSSSVIYTTHSHHLINPMWLENTHVVRNKGLDLEEDVTVYHGGKTDIVVEPYRLFASQHPEQSHYFQPILDMLDYSPSSLEYVPDLVMVEGKNDYYSLRYMNDVVLTLGLDLHLLPGGGAGSLDDVIKLYLGWSRNFLVLLDSDETGEKQKKRYIELFGFQVEKRIFTLKDFDSKLAGKSLERAFEKTDRDAIQSFAYSGQAYTKKSSTGQSKKLWWPKRPYRSAKIPESGFPNFYLASTPPYKTSSEVALSTAPEGHEQPKEVCNGHHPAQRTNRGRRRGAHG